MTETLDLAALRKEAETMFGPSWVFNRSTILSLLDQIDEWEATDKANVDERKQLLDRIEGLTAEVVRLNEIIGEGPS